MATKIQIRRDTASNWTSVNPTLSNGEFGYETDTNKLKIGDGSTAYNSLSYFVPGTLGDISDVNDTSATTGQVLTTQSDGSFAFDTPFDGAYSSLTGSPTNISDFTNDSGFITTYSVTQSDVTAHQAALSITESQISDLQTYLTTVALNDVSNVSTASATTGQVLTVQSDGTFAFEAASGGGASALGNLTDVDDTSATEGQVLTTQADGSYAFEDSAGGNVYKNTYMFTATASQTEFSGADDNNLLLDFTASQAMVFLNGIRLIPTTDYTESTDTITLTVGATAGDTLIVITWELATPESAAGFQGSNYGYTSGGFSPPYTNVIDKFPFSSDANATDVGDTTVNKQYPSGQSSTEYGYNSGGQPSTYATVIDKFSFAVDGNATDVGDLTTSGTYGLAGQSSTDYGYASGGADPSNTGINNIQKFSFSADANATDVGDLTIARYYLAGQSSTDYGYNSGGILQTDIIDKFPFSTDGNATDVGDLTAQKYWATGQSSTDYGYTSGGRPTTNVIDKFPFATDGNATDVGDLTVTRYAAAGQSSTDYGYTSGGYTPYLDTIDKFPFSSDANATDVGDLTDARRGVAGQQY